MSDRRDDELCCTAEHPVARPWQYNPRGTRTLEAMKARPNYSSQQEANRAVAESKCRLEMFGVWDANGAASKN